MNNTTSRRFFLKKSALVTSAVGLLSTQAIASSMFEDKTPYKGYNPYIDETSDLRTNTLSNYVEVTGTLFDTSGKIPLNGVQIEVWHLSPNSSKYRHRGKFFTDANGNYTFKTNFPNREKGKAPRIYFKISTPQKKSFSELIIQKTGASITSLQWKKNQALGNRLLPSSSNYLTKQKIIFNLIH